MRFGIILVFIVALSAKSVLADELDDEIKELLELSNVIEPTRELGTSMLEQLKPALTAQLSNAFASQGVDLTRAEIGDIVDTFATRFLTEFSEDLIPLTVSEFRKHFSLNEIRELKALMKTEAFQKYAQRLPDIMQTARVAGQQAGAKLGQEIMVDILRNHPKFKSLN